MKLSFSLNWLKANLRVCGVFLAMHCGAGTKPWINNNRSGFASDWNLRLFWSCCRICAGRECFSLNTHYLHHNWQHLQQNPHLHRFSRLEKKKWSRSARSCLRQLSSSPLNTHLFGWRFSLAQVCPVTFINQTDRNIRTPCNIRVLSCRHVWEHCAQTDGRWFFVLCYLAGMFVFMSDVVFRESWSLPCLWVQSAILINAVSG